MLRVYKIAAILLCVCAILDVQAIEVDCGPEEEAAQGSVHVITCTDLTNSTVTWRFVQGGVGESTVTTVGQCFSNNACHPSLPELYQLSREGARSKVRVQEVQRDGKAVVGEWRCQQDSSDSDSCRINRVFWPPEVNRNKCTVSFHEYRHEVNAECHIIKVFPQANCQWLYNREDYSPQPVPSAYTKISHRELSTTDGQVFYDTYCHIDKMTLPKEEGNYEFEVIISPGAVRPSVVFNGTNTIKSPDKPVLDTSCRTGYIDYPEWGEGDVICICSASNMGSPLGLLQWIHPEGYVISSEKSSPIDLHLKAVEKGYSNMPFTCAVQHHTGVVNVTYRPKLAYGPESVFVRVVESNAETFSYKFKCTVEGANPQPNIMWSGDLQIQHQGPTDKDGSYYTSEIQFKVLKHDTVVTCSAENPGRVNSQLSANLTAKGPEGPTPKKTGRTGSAPSAHPHRFLTAFLSFLCLCLVVF